MHRVSRRPTQAPGPVARRAAAGGCWLALVLLAPGQALAAHPLITDDTGTQGRGKFQLELNGEISDHARTVGGVEVEERARELAAVVSMGVLEQVDVVVGVPWASSDVREGGVLVAADRGLGDTSVEVKWRFLDVDGFSLAVKPGLAFGGGNTSLGATLIATQAIGSLTLHANAGFSRNEFKLKEDRDANRGDIWHGSLAAALGVVKGLQAVVNAGVETNGDRSSNVWTAFALGGAIYSVTGRLDIDLGVKAGLNDAEPDLAGLAGMTLRF
jgi:hypothetical protein